MNPATGNETGKRGADESFQPFELNRPVPLFVTWVAIALTIWGALLLFQNPQPVRQRAVAAGNDAKQTSAHIREQPRSAGERAFSARCSTCHQPNASGVRQAVPPLAGSPFVAAPPQVMVQILLHGIDGPIRVGDTSFDGHMPDFSSVLDDAEIALIVNHVRGQWGKASGDDIDAAFVAAQRQRFPGRGAWQGGAELAQVLAPTLAPQPDPRPLPQADTDAQTLQLIDHGQGMAWSCVSCHGVRGQGRAGTPRLAGMPADYFFKQLRNYLDGSRHNESMQQVAHALTPAQMRGLAHYYAGLRAPSNARPALGGDLARGEQLALRGDWSRSVPACFSCHGPSGFGVAPNFPPLAAQHPEYTAAQLVAWTNRLRDNSDVQLMDHIARALDDADRRAVADYLATLPPVPAVAEQAPATTPGPVPADAGDANAKP